MNDIVTVYPQKAYMYQIYPGCSSLKLSMIETIGLLLGQKIAPFYFCNSQLQLTCKRTCQLCLEKQYTAER